MNNRCQSKGKSRLRFSWYLSIPEAERNKELLVYDPSEHHYEEDAPIWAEILPEHYVLANQEEINAYKAKFDSAAQN